eukprot:74218_1
MASVKHYLTLCNDVKTDPLSFSMVHPINNYLRYFLLCSQVCKNAMLVRQCIDATQDDLTLLQQLLTSIDLINKDRLVLVKDNFIAIHCDSVRGQEPDIIGHINTVCVNAVKYYLKHKENAVQCDDEEKDKNAYELLLLAKLSEILTDDKLVATHTIAKGKFLTAYDFDVLLKLSLKNNQMIKDKNYKTKRCLKERYFAFRTPAILMEIATSVKYKAKRNIKE